MATVYDLNSSESQNAFETEIKSDSLTQARALELKLALQGWKPIEIDASRKRSLTSTLNAKIRKNGWTGTDVTAAPTEEEKEIQAVINPDTRKDCGCGSKDDASCTCETDWSKVDLTADEKTYFEDEEGLYAEMIVEMDAAIAAGELKADDCKDAKLSTEKRKSLGSSTFCGPNRSFPVPDCAHVTAARRLIGRAKVGDGTKSKILACVSRKASSLGCGGKKDEAAQVAENHDTIQVSDEFKAFVKTFGLADGVASEALGYYASLDKAYRAADDDLKGSIRSVHYGMGERWSADSQLSWAKEYLKSKDKDSVFISSKDLADKEEAVNRLTDEVAILTVKASAADAAKAASGEMLKAVKRSLATQIVMYRSLTGHVDYKGLDKPTLNTKIDELSKRHVTSLKDAVVDIMSELKWVEPTAATPTEKVTEPGKTVADNAQVDPAVAVVDSVTSTTETEAEKLKKQQVANAALHDRLASMTTKERKIYLADLAYNDAKTARDKK